MAYDCHLGGVGAIGRHELSPKKDRWGSTGFYIESNRAADDVAAESEVCRSRQLQRVSTEITIDTYAYCRNGSANVSVAEFVAGGDVRNDEAITCAHGVEVYGSSEGGALTPRLGSRNPLFL